MMDHNQRKALLNILDTTIASAEKLNTLLEENGKIMESHNNVTVPINNREHGRSTR